MVSELSEYQKSISIVLSRTAICIPILHAIGPIGDKRQMDIKSVLVRNKIIKSAQYSINYHLGILRNAGLVNKKDLSIGISAYSLTEKGLKLLSSMGYLEEFLQSDQDYLTFYNTLTKIKVKC